VAQQETTSSSSSTQQDQPSTSGRSKLTTEEWRAKYEKDGAVDLFLVDHFNAAMVLGRKVADGSSFGVGTGEGPSKGDCASYKVKIYNHFADETVELEVPEDRYIMWEAEDQGYDLPYACRMGCCTACAVKVKEGSVYQPQALGVSEELKAKGFALLCVSFPSEDCVLETVPEDEVYDLQFGRYFAMQALNKDAESVERDDFALEIAMGDE
jgi:ferredoxin